jgi:hypothetical protein
MAYAFGIVLCFALALASFGAFGLVGGAVAFILCYGVLTAVLRRVGRFIG